MVYPFLKTASFSKAKTKLLVSGSGSLSTSEHVCTVEFPSAIGVRVAEEDHLGSVLSLAK